jgi:hypothetical protein
MTVNKFTSVHQLAANKHCLGDHFKKIFSIQEHQAVCRGTPELLERYGSPIDNVQDLISIRNKITSDLVWFNKERLKKPQQFVSSVTKVGQSLSPTSCDFCSWETMTAQDTFGRIEGEYCVTGSNLFKYIGPYQAICCLKEHDPLNFTLDALCDVFNVSSRWFKACDKDYGEKSADDLHPMVVWNCNARSGASQIHGHIQLMQSKIAFPQQEVMRQHILPAYPGNYYDDLMKAHDEVGLSRRIDGGTSLFAHIAPFKDRDMWILGDSIEDFGFQYLVYCGLRTIIEELDTSSFNVGVYPRGPSKDLWSGVVCRIVSRGRDSSRSLASDYGGLEVFSNASIGHTDPFDVIHAFDEYRSREVDAV